MASLTCVSPDIWACYKQWGDRGAFFLTQPLDNHGWEWRCYMRDPDGYLIEVGQYTQMALDHFKNDATEVSLLKEARTIRINS